MSSYDDEIVAPTPPLPPPSTFDWLQSYFKPRLDKLKEMGAIQAKIESFPDFRSATINVVLSVRGYEQYTIECFERDYKKWKEQETYSKWEHCLDDEVAYRYDQWLWDYNHNHGLLDTAEDKEMKGWIKEAKRAFREHNQKLKKYNTLLKWIKSNESSAGIDFYNRIKKGQVVYHLIRYGARTQFTSELLVSIDKPDEIISFSISRLFTNMEKSFKDKLVKLPPSLQEQVKTSPMRYCSWLVTYDL